MREIKLRVWDKTRKTMFEAVGYYPTLKSVDVIYKYKDGVSNKVNLYGDTFVLMQYTGLKDKNGKEIYEGDILKIDEDEHDYRDEIIGEIAYDSFTYKLKRNPQSEHALKAGYIDYIRFWKDGMHDWYSLEQIDSYSIEVIGNIYENPELLNK